MILNKMLSETEFKTNPEHFGLPLFFLVSSKEDMLKMLNSVCTCLHDAAYHFHDYFKNGLHDAMDNDEDDEEIDVPTYIISCSEKEMEDAVYHSYSDEIRFEGKYSTFYIDNAEFSLDFTEPLVFFINFSDSFDRFGETEIRQVYHCKLEDLTKYKICLPEPTYFLND